MMGRLDGPRPAVTDAVADALIERLVPKIQALKVGPASDRSSEMGPVVTAAARDKIMGYIGAGEKEGAKIVVDGRDFNAPQGFEDGYFVGPTLIDNVTPDMSIWQEEIFGPVLSVVCVKGYEDGVEMINANPFANGTAIYTRDGGAARQFQFDIEVGMVGINVPIPVPLAYHTFGGWKRSAFGDTNQHGPEGVKFWTRIKTVTSRWPSGGVKEGSSFVIPTMK